MTESTTVSRGNSLLIHGVLVGPSRIVSGNLAHSHSLIGETLAADELTITIDEGMEASDGFYEGYIPLGDEEPYETIDDGVYFVRYTPETDTPPLDISAFSPGDEVIYYAGDVLVGKYYIQTITPMGRTRCKIEATSTVGLLIKSRHNGGVYSEAKAGTLFAEILSGISYTILPALANAVIYGFLPRASRRDNLQQLLFATGGALFPGADGTLNITTMSDSVVGSFDASRCYIGGSVPSEEPPSGVQVTEHNYFATSGTEPETLLEEGVDGEITVEFSGPHYDLACTGGTIVESSANHAVIQAHAFVTLTGKPYTHITRIVTAGDASDTDNVKTITNATLVNPQIAQALAIRLLDYVQHSTRIKQDVLFGIERAGQMVEVFNPYTREMDTALIKSLNVTLSHVNKASGDFLIGFTPYGVLSGYQNYIVLTGSGEWTFPAGSTTGTGRAILVSAGSGGGGGEAGGNGKKFSDGNEDYRSVATTNAETRAGGESGKGGKAGAGGAGGKIFEFTFSASPGQVFSYSCGAGGVGGTGGLPEITESRTKWEDNKEIIYDEVIQAAASPASGTAGGATVFGGRSSEWGKLYPDGYYEQKTGLTLGVSGGDGKDGAIGGYGGRYPNSDGEAGEQASGGVDCLPYKGGAPGVSVRRVASSIPPDNYVWASGGGGGGGASYAADGEDGTDGDDATGGAGGNGGGGGTSANGATYGCGGFGGHGGGGGGGGGAALYRDFAEAHTGKAYAGKPGIGGVGGQAGNGADGVIIIYF